MAAAAGERAMPRKLKRDDTAVKIARDLAIKAGLVVRTGVVDSGTIAEYLTGLLRGQVERDYKKARAKLDGQTTAD